MVIKAFFVVGGSFVLSMLMACSPDVLPTKYVYNVDINKGVCDRYVVSDYEDIKFRFEKAIPTKECPSIFGFDANDTGKVMSYIRRVKKDLEECGQ